MSRVLSGSLALAFLVALAPVALGAELPPLPDAKELSEGVEAAADRVAEDPVAAVRDPGNALQPILDPGAEKEPAPPEGPAKDQNPGFADRIQAAFADQVMVVGIAGAAATLAGVAGFAMVTRYVSPKEALKNPQRAMLYGFVRGNPGVHLKKLSEEFAMKTSSILWHIRKLESAELVRSERASGFRVFYPVDGGIEVKRVSRALAALQNRNARAIFEAVDQHPGRAVADLSLRLAIHQGTVRWHLRKLREYGLVEELVRDDGSLFFGTPLGHRTLVTMLGSPVAATPAPAVFAPSAVTVIE